MPPAPIRAITSYGPTCEPGERHAHAGGIIGELAMSATLHGVQPQTARRLLSSSLCDVLVGMISLAFLAVVMPTSGMAAIADWLGVGPLHRSPLTEYLTRSLSAMYGVLGILHLYLARDVVRHLDLIVVLGWLTVLAGVIQTVIDFA